RVHDFGVADELHGHAAQRLGDIVITHAVVIALDGDDQQPVDRPEVFQHARDFVGLGNVERDTAYIRADLARGGRGAFGGAARNDYIAAERRVSFRQCAADAAR